jgi:hypothetical protein
MVYGVCVWDGRGKTIRGKRNNKTPNFIDGFS